MNNYIKLVPLALLSLYSVKLFNSGANFTDAPVILVLSTLYAFLEYKLQDSKIQNLQTQLNDLNKKVDDKALEFAELKNSVSSLKINQMRAPNVVR